MITRNQDIILVDDPLYTWGSLNCKESVFVNKCNICILICVTQVYGRVSAKVRHSSSCNIAQIICEIVARIKNNLTRCTLIPEDIGLTVDVLLVIIVEIKVVRRNVGNYRIINTSLHAEKLERREFEHDLIFGSNLLYLIKKRCTDVAAKIAVIACILQDLIYKCGCCCLTVRACDTECLGRTKVKEQLHLSCKNSALPSLSLECIYCISHLGSLKYETELLCL